jgi:hypothetical protein
VADPPPDASETYAGYVKDELDRQIERKASFEQRGLSVITTSGTLVTLLFGLAALSTKEAQTFTLPGGSKTFLVIALIFFVIAIIAALCTNVPWVYKNVTPEGLRSMVHDHWGDDEPTGRRKVAYTQIAAITSARSVNGVKAWILLGAIASELLALVSVAIAVSIVILD